jgi:hypothetical protein
MSVSGKKPGVAFWATVVVVVVLIGYPSEPISEAMDWYADLWWD